MLPAIAGSILFYYYISLIDQISDAVNSINKKMLP